MAKKEDKDDKSTPKILLKLKEKEKTPSQPQISIAARPVNADVNAGTSNSTDSGSKSQISGKIQNANSITSKDAKEAKSTSKETPIILTNTNRPTLPRMSRPLPIVSDYYQILNSVQDYLVETNVDFFVIGIVGTQGSGKSTILNFLVDNSLDDYEGGIETINGILKGRAGIFKTRSHTKEAVFSNMPSTEGIQMYITKYRTILLDCSPVLCNPYKKDGILNELDDLKMLIFLLSVCNLLVVVEEPGFNMHLMRLIQTAENMKVDLFEKDLNELRMSPNILICKNKCRNRDFLPESKSRTNNLYKGFFHGSNLKLSAVYANRGMETSSISWNREENMNIFYFPLINDNSKLNFWHQ